MNLITKLQNDLQDGLFRREQITKSKTF